MESLAKCHRDSVISEADSALAVDLEAVPGVASEAEAAGASEVVPEVAWGVVTKK